MSKPDDDGDYPSYDYEGDYEDEDYGEGEEGRGEKQAELEYIAALSKCYYKKKSNLYEVVKKQNTPEL